MNAALTILTLIVGGTIIFHYLEDWSWTDSFYFTGVSLLTIGYGDLVPTTNLSKILVVFFGFASVGLVFYFVSLIGENVAELHLRARNLASDILRGDEKAKAKRSNHHQDS